METREWIYYGGSAAVVLIFLFVFYATRGGGSSSSGSTFSVDSLFKPNSAGQSGSAPSYADMTSYEMNTLPYDMMSIEQPTLTPDPVVMLTEPVNTF